MDINLLPVPQSRSELFLNYIARNMNAGGGNGGLTQAQVQAMINELVKDATFDESTKQLTLTKKDNSTINIDLSSLVGGTTNTFNTDINFIPAIIQQVAEAPNGTPTSFCMDRYVRVEPFKIINKVGVQIRGFNNETVIPTNVKVYAINADTHEAIEILHDGTNDVSIETINGVRYAVINVNKSYDVNVTFAFYVQRQGNYGSGSGIAINDTANKNLMYSNNQPNLGLRLAEWTSVNWSMGVYVEFVSSKVGEITKEVANKIGQYNSTDKEYQLFSTVRGDFENSTNFRIPAIVVTPRGTIISASDIRRNTAYDQSLIDNGISRSTDGGKTWTQQVVMTNSGVSNVSRVMDSTMLSAKNGDVYILCGAWDNNTGNWESSTITPDPDWKVRLAKSTDDGVTWTETEISRTTLNQPQNTISWLGGVGTGIEMSDGTLVFSIQICRRDATTNSNYVTAGIIYSTDNGTTWTMSTSFTPQDNRISENMVAEVEDGMLVLTGRNESNGVRPAYYTTDLGTTWQTHDVMHNLINTNARPCQGSFVTFDTLNGHRVGLVSTPTSGGSRNRHNLGVTLIDFNTGRTKLLKVFFPLPYTGGGYSSLATGFYNGRRILVVAYEAQGQIHYQDLTYLLADIESLMSRASLVSGWEDLEFTDVTIDFTNLATNADIQVGQFTNNDNSNTNNSNSWRRIYIPVENGKTYRIMNKRGETKSGASNLLGSSRFILLGNDKTTYIASQSVSNFTMFNRNGIEFTVNNTNAHYIGFNLYNAPNDQNWNNPTPFEELMVWDVEQTPDKPFIEGTTVKGVILDGGKIHTTFTSTTGLTSTTVSKALDELNEKMGNLNGIVDSWDDLDYTVQYPIINLFNPVNVIDGEYYSNTGYLFKDQDWCRIEMICQAGDIIKIAKKRHDSNNFVIFNKNGVKLENITANRSSVNGWLLYTLTIPSNQTTVAKVNINIHKQTNSIDDEVMIFREKVDPPTDYVPATGGKNVLIDSSHVGLLFDNTETTLVSKTIDGAVIELAKRVITSIIGELKTLAYDAGEQFELDGNTWLRCNGQTITKSLLNIDEGLTVGYKSITLPISQNGEYKYICIK